MFFAIFVTFANQVADFEVHARCIGGRRMHVDLRHELRRWTRVEAFFKSTKSENSSGARTCLGRRATNAVSEARHERSENCFLTLFPSIRERARIKKRTLAFRSPFSFFQLLHFPVNDVRDHRVRQVFLSRGYLTYVSNVRINTNDSRAWLTLASCTVTVANCIRNVIKYSAL